MILSGARLCHDGLCAGEIGQRGPDRFEERDLVIAGATMAFAAHQLSKIRHHLLARDHAALHGHHDVPGFRQHAVIGVHADAAASDGGIVDFAHAAREATHEIEMGAGREPFAPHDGFARRRSAAHDVRLRHRGGQIAHGIHR